MNKLTNTIELFNTLDTESLYELLLDLGSQGDFPQELKTKENFVNGCQSQVWVVAFEEQGKLRFYGYSDSYMARGVVYLLCDICSDLSQEDLVNLNWATVKDLGKNFSAQRKRGMQAMLNKIRRIVQDYYNQH